MNDISVFAVVFALCFALTSVLMIKLADLNDRDMRVCQLTYSHDTCFSALNR